jgi:hypothetical protein
MVDFTRTLTDIEKANEDWLKYCKNCPGKYFCNYGSIEKCRTLDNPEKINTAKIVWMNKL